MKIITCSLITFTILSGFALNSFGQNYIPFVSKTGIPQSVTGVYNSLQGTVQPGSTVQSVELQHTTVYFDQRMASLMGNVVQTHGMTVLPDYTNCIFDEEMGKFQNAQHPVIKAALDRAGNLCWKMHQPEMYYHKGSVFKPGLLSMTSMVDVLETIVTPSALQNVPFSLFDVPTTQSIRSAMLRVRYSVVEKDYADLFKKLDAVSGDSGVSAFDKNVANSMKQKAAQKLSLLRAWDQAGKIAYRADAARLSSLGKSRGSLEFDDMPDSERKNLTMYAYAMMWRFRGGGYVPLDGTQKARLYYANLPYAILARLNGLDTSTASAIGADMFLKLAIKGWGHYMDMGTTPNEESEMEDLVHMSERGLYQTSNVQGLLSAAGYNDQVMKYYTLQFGICYMFSFDQLKGVYLKEKVPAPFNGFYDWPTAWAEHCAGAALGLGLTETLLSGR